MGSLCERYFVKIVNTICDISNPESINACRTLFLWYD